MSFSRNTGMVTFTHKGDFKTTETFLKNVQEQRLFNKLHSYGRKGVDALRAATPKDTGKTSESWTYEIERSEKGTSIYWSNTNVNKGVNIAVILQHGHGTKNGGYVKGIDYINPAMRPIFDAILQDVWKEVTAK